MTTPLRSTPFDMIALPGVHLCAAIGKYSLDHCHARSAHDCCKPRRTHACIYPNQPDRASADGTMPKQSEDQRPQDGALPKPPRSRFRADGRRRRTSGELKKRAPYVQYWKDIQAKQRERERGRAGLLSPYPHRRVPGGRAPRRDGATWGQKQWVVLLSRPQSQGTRKGDQVLDKMELAPSDRGTQAPAEQRNVGPKPQTEILSSATRKTSLATGDGYTQYAASLIAADRAPQPPQIWFPVPGMRHILRHARVTSWPHVKTT